MSFLMPVLALLALAFSACQNQPRPRFRESAEATGLKFHHFSGATGRFHMPEIVGPGGAVFDYDGDGDLDVYLIQSGLVGPDQRMEDARIPPPAGWKPGNRLFRNDLVPSGRLRFTDVTEESGTGHDGIGMGAAVGDVDGDGDPDLFVTNFGPNILLRNDGAGRFTDITAAAGVAGERWSTSAVFFDFDRDGDLDLYHTRYVAARIAAAPQCKTPAGAPDYCGPQVYRPEPDVLYENLGGGRFRDISEASGIAAVPGPGLGVTAVDLNGDGWLDLFVANDGAANHAWLNQKDGTFRQAALESGVAYAEDGIARAGMGVTAGDTDGDGRPDLIVTNLTNEGATFFAQGGEGGFFDRSRAAGLAQPTARATGFGVGLFDMDNDGWLDLFLANGEVRNLTDRTGPYPYQQRNQLLRNAAGSGYLDVSAEAGAALAMEGIGRGAIFGDLDNDGDVDIIVCNNNGPARLLINEAEQGGMRGLTVRVIGPAGNPDGYGTCVEMSSPGRTTMRRCVQPGYSYLVSNDPRVHFGLGTEYPKGRLAVIWPNGEKNPVEAVAAGAVLTVKRLPSR